MSEVKPTVTRVLVVHEDPTMILMLRRTFESERCWELTGARSAAAALERLALDAGFQGVILSWSLPDTGALHLLAGLQDRSGARPWVLALHGHWNEDDLARAVQTGVDGFLSPPLTVEAVATEVEGLSRGGETPTRSRLLSLAGTRLLRADERLWQHIEEPLWRQRMSRLAAGLRAKAGVSTRAAGERLVARLDALFGRPVGQDCVRILRAHLTRPTASADELARQAGAESLRARAYIGVLHELFGTGSARQPLRSEAAGAVAIAAEIIFARPDVEPVSAAEFERLRLLGAEILASPDEPRSAAARDELTRKLAHLMHAPVAALTALSPEAQTYVAAGVVDAAVQVEAIDRARLAVLQSVLNAMTPDGCLDGTRLRALAAALGVVPPPDAGVTPRLLQLAAALYPEPGIETIDVERLAALEEALRRGELPPDLDVAALQARLAQLRAALDPGAIVDLQRVSRLVDAWEAQKVERIGLATVGAIVRSLDRGRPDPVIARLYACLGVQDLAGQQRVLQSAVVLRELRPVPALDSLRLQMIFQRALGEAAPPDAARMRALIDAVDLAQGMDRAAAGRLADAPPVPLERVRVEAHVAQLARRLESPDLRLGLSPDQMARLAAMFASGGDPAFPGLSAEAVLRLRVLALVIVRPGRDPVSTLERVLGASGRDVRALVGLASIIPEPGRAAVLPALRGLVGLTERACTAKDVEGHLANGRVEAAALGLGDLSDNEPRLLGLLNEAALALRTLGRGEEGEPLYRRALRLAPTRLNLLFNFGRLLFEAGRFAECVAIAERCYELAPDFGMAESLLRDARAKLEPAAA
ncbi:hypothetical protein L6V77_22170 [Myxococcota bacterium]|nr:hypothetical protein [Myxococcota bacterium]